MKSDHKSREGSAEPVAHSGSEAITAGLGHQNFGACRITLDLLAKAVHVGLQRVGCYPGIVPPHLAKEGVAPDCLIARAVEVFEDRRLLFGQPHLLAAARIEQELGAGAKRVRADRENRVVAVLALAQMRTQPREQDAEPKGL